MFIVSVAQFPPSSAKAGPAISDLSGSATASFLRDVFELLAVWLRAVDGDVNGVENETRMESAWSWF